MLRASHLAWVAAALAVAGACGACDACDANRSAADAGSPPVASTTTLTVAPPVPKVAWDPKVKADAIARGKEVFAKNECTRCHVIDDVAKPTRPNHCTGCHEFLHGLKPGGRQYEEIKAKYGPGILERYQRNIVDLLHVPNLSDIGKRVRGDYIARFLAEPYDQRPTLDDSMIRHKLSPDEIKAVVRYFVAVSDAPDPYAPGYAAPTLPPKPDAARLQQGKHLFMSRGCTACHTFGNVETGMTRQGLEGAAAANALAPNLRFAPERTRPDVIVSWIVNAPSILPGTAMPPGAVSVSEAESIRDWLFYADPELKPAPPPPAQPDIEILNRPVPYAEMKEKVLGKVCVHCHMNDFEKDTGPGNGGGFGYHGIGLAMRTYEALVHGAVGADGKRYSVLIPRKGEKYAPLLEAMLRRRVEEQRDHVPAFDDYERPHYPERLGMPMGLPAMSADAMSLLATWIVQGCQGPTKVIGKPGVGDGYLVQDGPLKKNKGCELRNPEHPRPAWAYDQKK